MKLTTSTANRMVADLTKMPVSKFALMDYNDIQTLIKLIRENQLDNYVGDKK